jgi:hypothetical protein
MAQVNDLLNLQGLFKEVYGDLKEVIPDGVKFLNMIPFIQKDKQPGGQYVIDVVLGLEHGVTYADGSGAVVTLNNAVAGATKPASVKGAEIYIRAALSYLAVQRSLGGGAKAFKDASKLVVGNMMRSLTKRLEASLMYGSKNIGIVDSVAGLVITLEASDWAPGIWAGAEGMEIEVFAPLAGETDAPDTAVQRAGVAIVTAVNFTAKTITVNALPTGTVAGDVLCYRGAAGKEMAGLHKILTNTGTLFGINATSYQLWKGAAYAPSSTSVLSFAIVEQAITRAVEKGLDSDVVLLVNPGHFDDLLTEQAAKRMYDSSYGSDQMENGAKSLKFHGQNGMIEIVPSIYVKEGFAYGVSKEDFVRVGSTDITFRDPLMGDQYIKHLENSTAYEMRAWTDQALFCSAPGRSFIISNLKAE